MDDETWVRDATLAQYQQFFFRENYENGEPNTEIQIKADNKPPLLMVLNQKDGQSPTHFCEEKNTRESHTSFLKTWGGDKEAKTVDVETSDLYLALVNLGPQPTAIKVTVSRRPGSPGIRKNTFSVISKVLMGILVAVIGLLVVFSVITMIFSTHSVTQGAKTLDASTPSPESPSTKKLPWRAADAAT